MKTIKDINLKYLCTSCGACASICPVNAIKMGLKDGQFYPAINESKCIKCGKCIDVCPGISVSLNKLAEKFWPNNKCNFELGRFRKTYIGYSNDSVIRFKSASGGIATTLVCSLLKKRIIDGAIITKMNDKSPLRAESCIARTEKEVISAQSSKYCPTSPVSIVKQLKNTGKEEKFALVGLPCHIHGIRKLQEKEEWIKKKIILTLGLFCSHGVTTLGTNLILDKFAKGIKNVDKFQYRGRGWPGGVHVKYKNGEEFNIPHDKYWPPFFAPYFFTPYRCLTCSDLTAELADISLGDAWLKEIKERDNVGTSIIIARSEFGEKVLANTAQSEEIFLKEIPYHKVIKAQRGILKRKKIGVGERLRLFKFLFKPIPEYDQKFKAGFKCYLGAILTLVNAMISRTKLGIKILKFIPPKLLRRYCSYVFRYSEDNMSISKSIQNKLSMKIAFIVGTFPALSETFILNQITELLDLGLDVEIFARTNPKDKIIHSDIEKYQLMERVYYFIMPCNKIRRILKAIFLTIKNFHKAPLKILKSLNVFKYGKAALSLRLLYSIIPFLDKNFDILYCHFGPNGILGTYLKEIGINGKLVTSFHGYDMSSFIISNGNNVYKKLFLNGDLFLPISNYWKRKLIRLGCIEKKIIVHRMGIDLEKFKFFGGRKQSGEHIKILTIGRLVEKKGHEYAIKAIAKIVKKHKNIEYIIAGDGPLRNKLEDLVSKLEIERYVKFLGAVEQREALKLYHQAHIFVLPSVTASNDDQEGIPVVLMEAQATGLPIVSTYHTGIPEVVLDGKSGFLVPENEVDALAEKLEYLIEHPEIWPDMGRCGRKYVEEKYDIKILNQQLVKIYKNLIKGKYE
jgi:coenzyme F420-reducing hydrogenase beta subunit